MTPQVSVDEKQVGTVSGDIGVSFDLPGGIAKLTFASQEALDEFMHLIEGQTGEVSIKADGTGKTSIEGSRTVPVPKVRLHEFRAVPGLKET